MVEKILEDRYRNSIADFNEAKMVIPGGVNSPVRAFGGVGGTPPFITKGEGAYLVDEDGNRYLDFVQSWGPLIFGHCDSDIEDAVLQAVKNGLSFGAPTIYETLLVKELVQHYEGLDKARLVSSGTEAVMSAIRLARAYSGKDGIIKFEGCYHGHSDSLLVKAGSGMTTFGNPSSPGVPSDFTKHTHLATYNDIESVETCFKESNNIGVVIIEPIAGNMGLVKSTPEFLKALRKLCDKYNAVLIFDEVMSGYRASFGGAQEVYGVVPDMATFGKVIGGGMPVGAFGGHSGIMKMLSPEGAVYQAGTLSGNPVAVRAGLTALKKLKDHKNLYCELESKAKRLVNGLKETAESVGIPMQVDFVGSMFGFFFNDKPVYSYTDALKSDTKTFAKFHREMLDRGYYFACSQFEAGFISTAMSEDMIDETIKTAKEVLSGIARYR